MAQRFDKLNLRTSLVIGRTGALDGAYPLDVWGQTRIRTGDSGGFTLNASHDDFIVEGNGNTGIQLFSPNSSYQYIAFGDPQSANAGYIRYYHGTNEMRLRTNGSDTITIASGGNVGIGTTSPVEKLDVAGNIRGAQKLILDANDPYIQGIGGNAMRIKHTSGQTMYIRPDEVGTLSIFEGSASPQIMMLGVGAPASNNASHNSATLSFNTRSRKSDGTAQNHQIYIKGVTYDIANNYSRLDITGANRYYFDNNVGIGTASPTVRLDVNGEIAIRGGESADDARMYFRASDNSNRFTIETDFDGNTNNDLLGFRASSTDNILVLKGNGNVGIGTGAPAYKLQVKGTSGTLSDGNQILSVGNTTGGTQLAFGSLENSYNWIRSYESGAGGRDFVLGTNAEVMRLTAGGNVGIGTTTPQKKLDVYLGTNNAVASIGGQIGSGEYAGLHFGYSEAGNSNYRHSAIVFERDDSAFGDARGNIHILNSSAGSTSADLGDARLTIVPSGNVGIGTSTPTHKLQVEGSADVVNIAGSGSTANTSIFSVDGNNGRLFEVSDDLSDSLFSVNTIAGLPVLEVFADNRIVAGAYNQNDFVISGSKVGIGTDTPTSQLEVGDPNTAGTGITVAAQYNLSNAFLRFRSGHPNNANIWETANISATDDGNYNGRIHFRTSTSGQAAPTDKMVIKANGNVGIGTTSPLQKLDLVGPAYFRGGTAEDFGAGDTPTDTALIIDEDDYIYTRDSNNLRKLIGKTSDIIYIGQGGTSLIDGINLQAGQTGYVAVSTTADGEMARFVDGKLGIGTTSPDAKLHVQGGAAIFNVSDDWHQSENRTHILRGGGFSSSIDENSTAVKVFNGSSVTGKSAGNYWGGIGFMHLDPEYSSWGTTYTGEHFWIGGRLIDTPGQERSALVFATNNNTTAGSHSSEKMVIMPDGNVGIGTTSPTGVLHVNGTYGRWKVNGYGGMYFNNNSDTNNTRYIHARSDGALSIGRGLTASLTGAAPDEYFATSFDQLYIKSDGNVGIGTTAPEGRLHVQGGDLIVRGNSSPSIKVQAIDASSPAMTANIELRGYDGRGKGIYLRESGSLAAREIFFGSTYSGGNSNFSIGYADGGGQSEYKAQSKFYVDLINEEVGIGTSNPTAVLHITASNSDGRYIKMHGGSSGHSLEIVDRSGYTTATPNVYIQDADNNGARASLRITGNNGAIESMFVASNGYTGLGTVTPDEKLHVDGNVKASILYALDDVVVADKVIHYGDTDTFIRFQTNDINLTAGGNNLFRVDGNSSQKTVVVNEVGADVDFRVEGDSDADLIRTDAANDRVGIGTSTPSAKLEVYGSGSTILDVQGSQGQLFSVTDSLVGSLFSVNDISGLPILEVFDTDKVVAGTFGQNTLVVTGSLVGIGTDTPSTKLDVIGAIRSTSGGAFGTDNHAASIFMDTGTNRGLSGKFSTYARNIIRSDGSATIEIGENTSLISLIKINAGSSSTNGVVSFMTKNSERMRVHHDGNVGIGTTSPTGKLEVSGNVKIGSTTTGLNLAQSGDDFLIQGVDVGGNAWNSIHLQADSLSGVYIEKDTNRVGIGTTSPDSKLHVNKNGNANGGTILMGPQGSGTNKWSYLAGTHYNQDTGTGNGTGNAGVALIGGLSTDTYNRVYIGGGPYEINPATEITFWTHTATTHTLGGTRRMSIASNGTLTLDAYGAGLLKTNASGVVSVDTSTYLTSYSETDTLATVTGRGATTNTAIGIGIATPSDGDLNINDPLLHVKGPDTSGAYNLVARFQAGNDANDTGAAIAINHSNDRGLLIRAGRKDSDRPAAYFDLIDSNGSITNMIALGEYGSDFRMGIGTTSPSAKLDVAGNVNVGSTLEAAAINVNNEYTLPTADGSAGQAFVTDGNGNISFGTISGGGGTADAVKTVASDTNATRYLTFVDSNNATATGETIYTTAGIYVNPSSDSIFATGNIVSYASSDKRFKDNLTPIANATEKISKLSGYEFDWNDKQSDFEGHDVGIVAQEVEEVLPEVVTTRKDGYKAVKYEKMVALLIEGMKEQQAEIEALKEEVRKLKG